MKDPNRAFFGDVQNSAEISLNRKGGSLTATLKKVLTGQIAAFQDISKVFGTSISLPGGDGLVVLSSLVEDDDPDVHMRKLSDTRYEIVIGEEPMQELDPVSLGLLSLKEADIAAGRAELSAPMSAEDIRARHIP